MMGKKTFIGTFIIMFTIITGFLLFQNSGIVEAATVTRTNKIPAKYNWSPNMENVDTSKITKSSNIITYKGNTSMEGTSDYFMLDTTSLGTSRPDAWVKIPDVGEYNGKNIDMIIRITDWKLSPNCTSNSTGGVGFSINTASKYNCMNFERAGNAESVTLKIEYYESGTNNKVQVSGIFNLSDIDVNNNNRDNDGMIYYEYAVPTSSFDTVFVSASPATKCHEVTGTAGTGYVCDDVNSDKGEMNTLPAYSLGLAYTNKDTVNVTYGMFIKKIDNTKLECVAKGTNGKYETTGAFFGGGDTIGSIELPDPVKAPADRNITTNVINNSAFQYTVKQYVPYAGSAYYLESFVFEDTLNAALTPVKLVSVKNEKGIDVTSLFKTSPYLSGQKFTATLINPNNKSFYNHTYTFTLEAKVNPDKISTLTKTNGVYSVPNTATVKVKYAGENTTTPLNTNTVNVRWITPPETPTKSPATQDVTSNVKANTTFDWTIEQKVPSTPAGYHYSKFVFTDQLNELLQCNNDNASSCLTIKKGTQDVTSWFDVALGTDKRTITATLKSGNNVDAFYNSTYQFIVHAKVKSGLKDSDVANYRKGTVYEVPNKATITTGDSNDYKKSTNTAYAYWYRGMCPGGECSNDTNGPEPKLKPTKTVSTKYTNNTTSFDYRVSQYVPGYNENYLWTDLTLTDTIDRSLDMNKTTVKVISSKYGENRDLSKGDDRYFDVTIKDHTITAKATANALKNSDFYGAQASGTTYTMVITTQVTEGFDFSGYTQTKENCKTIDGNEVCDTVYTVINNQASRTFKDKHNSEYKGITNTVPTTQVDPKIPSKEVDTKMVRSGFEYHYNIKDEVQPAGYQKSSGTATQAENNLVYYESYIFTDVLEAPLQIQDASKVKITQIDASGKKKDYTEKFNISISEDKRTITATLKNPKDPDFYGTRGTNDTEILKTYEFELTVSLRDNPENSVDMSKYVDETGLRYVIPNKGTITTQISGNEPTTKETNNVNVYYYPDPDPKKDVSEDNITNLYLKDQKFTFKIEKTVLSYDENLYYSSFVFKDTLEDCLEATDDIAIKNETGIVLNGWFDIKVEGQTITATLKDPSNKNFYGHTYTFNVNTKVKKGYKLDKYRQGNQYVIPNVASFIYDNKTEVKTNEKQVYINHQSVAVPKTSANIPLYVSGFASALVALGIGGYLYVNKKKNLKNSSSK